MTAIDFPVFVANGDSDPMSNPAPATDPLARPYP